MTFFHGHFAVYIERNNLPFWKEWYIERKGGLKICIGRLVFWYKHLRNA